MTERYPDTGRLYRATLSLLPTSEGGRLTPIRSGYRPTVWLGQTTAGRRVFHDAEFTLPSAAELAPGQAASVYVRPAHPEHWSHVCAGAEVSVYEGNHKIGTARIDSLRTAW